MKKVIIMFALAMGIVTANAQENVTVVTDNGSEQPTLTKEVYPQKEADGDLYHGLTKKLTFDRMVPPHGLEVTYDKTVHVIFPSEVREELPERNQYVRDNGGREFLYLQREICLRTVAAQCGDVRLHP